MLIDTKLKADIAESAVTTKLLKLGFRVLKPIGDRLPYDLAIEENGRLIRLQIKSAWDCGGFFSVDCRRTKTNRRVMLRALYSAKDFDFAVLYIEETDICYVMPIDVFLSYKSGIALVERDNRQRKPRSHAYREAWHLLKFLSA
jgi:hypothetical protein